MDWPWFAVAVSRPVFDAFYISGAALTGMMLVLTIFGCAKKEKRPSAESKPRETGSLSLKVTKSAKGGAMKSPDDASKGTGASNAGASKNSDDKLNNTKARTTTESKDSKFSKENAKTTPSHLKQPPNKVITVAVGQKPPPPGRKAGTEQDKVIPMPERQEPSSQGLVADQERTVERNGTTDAGGGTTNEKSKISAIGEVGGGGCGGLTKGKFEKTQTEASQTQSKSKHSEEGANNGP